MTDPQPDPYRDVAPALHELARNTTRLTILAAKTIAELQTEANQHDSHRTTASGRVTDTRGNTEHTRVEHAALTRLDDNGPTTEAWNLYDQIICARDATRHALRTCIDTINRTTPNPPYLTPTEKRRMYCIETDCHDYASHDGRCERHHLDQQRTRWANERRRRRHA